MMKNNKAIEKTKVKGRGYKCFLDPVVSGIVAVAAVALLTGGGVAMAQIFFSNLIFEWGSEPGRDNPADFGFIEMRDGLQDPGAWSLETDHYRLTHDGSDPWTSHNSVVKVDELGNGAQNDFLIRAKLRNAVPTGTTSHRFGLVALADENGNNGYGFGFDFAENDGDGRFQLWRSMNPGDRVWQSADRYDLPAAFDQDGEIVFEVAGTYDENGDVQFTFWAKDVNGLIVEHAFDVTSQQWDGQYFGMGGRLNNSFVVEYSSFEVIVDTGIMVMEVPMSAGFVRMALQGDDWQLVGLPFNQLADDMVALDEVLGTRGFANGTEVMAWDGTGYVASSFFMGTWSGNIELRRGQGFWIKTPVDMDLYLLGQVPDEQETAMSLPQGLQLISAPYPAAIDLNDEEILLSVPFNGDQIFFLGEGAGYTSSSYFMGQWSGEGTLEPGKGYWYDSVDGQDMLINKPY